MEGKKETTTRYPSSTLLPFLFWGLLMKLNSRKKGTLIIKGLLGNLDYRIYVGLRDRRNGREKNTWKLLY